MVDVPAGWEGEVALVELGGVLLVCRLEFGGDGHFNQQVYRSYGIEWCFEM